jgi:hypothetical protein
MQFGELKQLNELAPSTTMTSEGEEEQRMSFERDESEKRATELTLDPGSEQTVERDGLVEIRRDNGGVSEAVHRPEDGHGPGEKRDTKRDGGEVVSSRVLPSPFLSSSLVHLH